MKVRTRMAPSPTGGFHIGGMRTLLYDLALARHYNGKFILRIEDTDQNRYVEGAVEELLNLLKDMDISYDEGPVVGGPHAPYVQSERKDIYKKYAQKLVDSEHAYYCFCTSERLATLRKEQQENKQPTRYDRHCLSLSKEQVTSNLESNMPYTIRFKMPHGEKVFFKDMVYGDLTFEAAELDDQILLKSDGFPTYHLAVVVDDHLMDITHILRGNDWLPSTPKHILLYKAFGWDIPVHAHLPNLKEAGESKKLSKRHGAVLVEQFLEEGYLPSALLNFLMFLGWNPGTDREIYSLEEFYSDFTVERLHKTDLVVFDRQKLLWLNGQYIRNLLPVDLFNEVKKWADRTNTLIYGENANSEYIFAALSLVQERMKLLSEYNELTHYFYKKPTVDKMLLIKQAKDSKRANNILTELSNILQECSDTWNIQTLHDKCYEYVQDSDYKPKEAFMTLRVAITGEVASPPIFDVIHLLGSQETISRIGLAQELLES
ncbi:MAG: glutamate--tRNA ligase [Patescibacteria group bacterium]